VSSIEFPHGNVFLDPASRRPTDDAGTPGARSPVDGSSLARLLSPLRTRMRPIADGHELVIQPMRPVDALGPFTAARRAPDTTNLPALPGGELFDRLCPDSATLLLGSRERPGPGDATCLAAAAKALGVPVMDRFGPDELVVDDFALARLTARPEARIAAAIRIEGPIEGSDATWIRRGLAAGVDPLAVELRTVRAMQVRPNRTLLVHVRHAREGLRFVAENLRHYLAAVAGLPLAEVAPPDVGLLTPLFEAGGEITVRPLETEVYSTSVDVGIVTSPPEDQRPADASLIYDLHGSSWHGD
jgi:hypothetical protein